MLHLRHPMPLHFRPWSATELILDPRSALVLGGSTCFCSDPPDTTLGPNLWRGRTRILYMEGSGVEPFPGFEGAVGLFGVSGDPIPAWFAEDTWIPFFPEKPHVASSKPVATTCGTLLAVMMSASPEDWTIADESRRCAWTRVERRALNVGLTAELRIHDSPKKDMGTSRHTTSYNQKRLR